MEWSKIKNIVLILLLATNLCLSLFVINRSLEHRQQLAQARDQAITFLQQNKIQVPEDLIPGAMDLRPKLVERDRSREETAARMLLGEEITVVHKGGEVYHYSSPWGYVQFHADGAFSAEFEPGRFPVGENPARSGENLLEHLGIQGDLARQEAGKLVFCQRWDGVPVFNQQVTLEYRDGALSTMSGGRRLTGAAAEDTSRSTVTVATALFSFYNGLERLGDVCSRISGLELGYVCTASLSGPAQLTPVWQIDTDMGRYQLDLVTGVLTRLSGGK